MSSPPDRARGRFFVLDGVDGCGKSTQAELLVRALAGSGPDPLHLREPGSTAIGEALRAILLDSATPLSATTELLLFAAARRAMLDELVEPALREGRDVVCERFHPSTFAYQAVGAGLDPDAVMDLLEVWVGTPAPDLVLLLDLDDAEARRRRSARGGTDRFEGRGDAFLERVAEGYREFARREERVRIVDAKGTPDEVAARILGEVSSHVR